MKTRTALCLVALVATSACEKQPAPLELAGAAAGAVVGGYAGAHLGAGFGQWAYIAGGAMLGGVGGYEAGRLLNESDLVLYRGTTNAALSSAGSGGTLDWKNPETGNSGIVRPSERFHARSGQVCRHFRSTVAFSDAIETGNGTACHQPDGSWQIISNDFG